MTEDPAAKREHLRRKTSVAVLIRSITTSAGKQRPCGVTRATRWVGCDVNVGGMGIETEPSFGIEVGDLIELELHLPGRHVPLSVAAKVRNLKPAERMGQPAIVAGLAFVRISDEDRQLIASYAQESGFII